MTASIVTVWIGMAMAIWYFDTRKTTPKLSPEVANQKYRRKQNQKRRKTYRQRYTYETNPSGPAVMAAKVRKTTKLK